jgi:hypothetical protein
VYVEQEAMTLDDSSEMPGRFMLIADVSSSAEAYWEEIAHTIQLLCQELPEGSISSVNFLGAETTVPPEYFAAGPVPPPCSGSSFMAPVAGLLEKQRQAVDFALVVGAGQIFDLADWQQSRWINRWALIRVGDDENTLKPPGVSIPEFSAAHLASLYTWLRTDAPTQPYRSDSRYSSSWASGDFRWLLDQTGYPLIFIPPLNAYSHLFPVVKAQFESFLINSGRFGDDWYQELLDLNPRLSYRQWNYDQYEQLILTGILPDEAEAFAKYQGTNHRLHTVNSWRATYQWLAKEGPAPPPPSLRHEGIADSAVEIWEGLLAQLSPKTMLELSLMGAGVNEWVYDQNQLVGLGQTRIQFTPQLYGPLEKTVPIRTTDRIKQFGFRLLRRET